MSAAGKAPNTAPARDDPQEPAPGPAPKREPTNKAHEHRKPQCAVPVSHYCIGPEGVTLEVDLPGVQKQRLFVDVSEGLLHIRATRDVLSTCVDGWERAAVDAHAAEMLAIDKGSDCTNAQEKLDELENMHVLLRDGTLPHMIDSSMLRKWRVEMRAALETRTGFLLKQLESLKQQRFGAEEREFSQFLRWKERDRLHGIAERKAREACLEPGKETAPKTGQSQESFPIENRTVTRKRSSDLTSSQYRQIIADRRRLAEERIKNKAKAKLEATPVNKNIEIISLDPEPDTTGHTEKPISKTRSYWYTRAILDPLQGTGLKRQHFQAGAGPPPQPVTYETKIKLGLWPRVKQDAVSVSGFENGVLSVSLPFQDGQTVTKAEHVLD